MKHHDMSQSILRSLTSVCLLSLLAVLSGCEKKQTVNPAFAPREQSPQAKFDRIMASLNDKLGTDPMSGRDGMYASSPSDVGSGTSVIHYSIQAPTEIAEPAPGELPTATIKITQSSSYSFFPAKPSEEEEEEEDGEKDSQKSRNSLGSTEEELDSMGIEILDPSKVDKDLAEAFAPKPKLKPLDTTARTIRNDTHVTYQLVYEKDRWRLASPPAADAMQATNMAIEQALKRQR
ncbi:hypothetical protein NG895_25200 [Aeoliella sp. ICT_H6.2]|uniref:Uncharacterized protein n=1 Tax=Aeoliella straminimaris TaxID=2954799 RepID=A0A9X2FDX9_9BACT|nr:hypothetical protein [Aeoliella straminimaris]MCO6047210.1 hypothetical protein [Aeoliella straminimaris]